MIGSSCSENKVLLLMQFTGQATDVNITALLIRISHIQTWWSEQLTKDNLELSALSMIGLSNANPAMWEPTITRLREHFMSTSNDLSQLVSLSR